MPIQRSSPWIQLPLLGLSLGLSAQTPIGNVISEQSRTAFAVEGAGARSMGLGGAFIGVADDATAVSFNPAGLAQLMKPEFCLVGQGVNRKLSYSDFRTLTGPREYEVSDSLIGTSRLEPSLLAGTLPLRVGGRTLALQLSAQRAFSLDLNDSRVLTETPLDPAQPTIRLNQRITQKGQIDLYSAAIAYEASRRILLGLAYNRWKGRWDLNSRSSRQSGSDASYLDLQQNNEFSGESLNFGLLWRWPGWSLGLVHRTAFHADYSFALQLQSNLDLGQNRTTPPTTVGLHWPASTGLGLALRPADRWLVAFDLRHTQWSEANYMSNTRSLNGVNFFDMDRSDRAPNATTAHLGAEHLWLTSSGWVVPLRAGLSREPMPVVDPRTGQQRVKRAVAVGTGLKKGPYTFDLSYRYAWGQRQITQFLDPAQILTGSQTAFVGSERLIEHRLDFSLIVQFARQPVERALHYLFVGD